jgi:transcriptional regulator with XRE-family HTH domain
MPQPDELERQELGVRLRAEREYLGFSQDEVAEALSITRSAVSLIESGQRKVEVFELKRLAALFGKSVGYLTGDEVKSKTSEPVRALARLAKGLSPGDIDELQKFAEFLRSRAGKSKRGRSNG